MTGILWHAWLHRRLALLWWSVGVACLAALLAVAYPTVRGNQELDKTFADLPNGVATLLGLGNGNPLTSPAGYLDSQFYANLLPLTLLIFGLGMAAWTVAGDEAAGTFELLVTNPVSRVRVAVLRLVATVILLAALATVSAVVLVALAPATGLDADLPVHRIISASIGALLLATTYSAGAFAIGAATGNRSAALAVASALAVVGYVVEGLAPTVAELRPFRFVNPWHWLLSADPIHNGLTTEAWLPPIVATVTLAVAAIPTLAHRDLRQ